ncbi:MAG TPA: LD-carboxypeptidase [Bdellovibrionota bacterium]|nr:LD-carboxypeptidase [Bdellovibrionota bacterium]
MPSIAVGITAPSSKVPNTEFQLGIEQIEEAGFKVHVHPQCRKGHWFFAGTDEDRAQAFFDYAMDPRFSILWCARGGYGATRLLPLLDRMTFERGIPEKKLLVGFSDITALMEYTRNKWGWATLHAPMPGLRKFCTLKPSEWKGLLQWIRGGRAENPWGSKPLRFVGEPPRGDIRGELIGGNLTVWSSMQGTPYMPRVNGKIIFFEDVDEALYRIDRLIHQQMSSGALSGAKAVILGNFQNCKDTIPKVIVVKPKPKDRDRAVRTPKPEELGPLRKHLNEEKMIPQLFGQIRERLGIPVAYGLPAGHGPGRAALPLGGEYRLRADGRFELLGWNWSGPAQ